MRPFHPQDSRPGSSCRHPDRRGGADRASRPSRRPSIAPKRRSRALIAALHAEDKEALIAVFGAENEDVVLTGDDADDRATWVRVPARLRDAAPDHDGRRRSGDAFRRTRPVALPGAARQGRRRLGLRRGGGARGGACAPDRRERARRHRPDSRLCTGAGSLPRAGSRRRRPPRLRGRADQRRGQAGRALLARRAWRAGEPVGDFMARAAADGYNFDGDGRGAGTLPRLLLPRPRQAG